LAKGRHAGSREPIAEGCPCPACLEHTRGYIHYLIRSEELTGVRLVTLHNLVFMRELMEGIRSAVTEGRLDSYRAQVLAGETVYS
jgi:queuine tRNA-ribosyltransferase